MVGRSSTCIHACCLGSELVGAVTTILRRGLDLARIVDDPFMDAFPSSTISTMQ